MSRGGLLGKIVGFSMVSVVSAVLSLVVVPVSTHLYDQDALGKINFFFSVTNVLLTLFCLGLDQGYVRFYPLAKDEGQRRRLLTFSVSACLCVVVAAGLVAWAFDDSLSVWLFGEAGMPATAMICLVTLCVVALRFFSLRYRMAEDVWGYTIFAGAVSVIQKGLYIVSAVVSTSYVVAVGWVALACLPILVAAAAHERAQLAAPDLRGEASLYCDEARFSLPLLASGLVAILTNYVPQFAIRSLLGFSNISVFTAALTVSLAVNLIQSGFNAFWAPYVYQHARDEQGKIMRVHEAVVMVAVSACMLLAMIVDLAFLLFKPNYAAGARLVPFLALGPLCYTIGETAGVGINLKMKSGLNLLISAATLASSVALSLALVPVLGLGGGAVSVGGAAAVGLALKTAIGEHYYQSIRDRSFMLRGLLPYVAVCVVALALPDRLALRLAIDAALLVLSLALYGPSRLRALAGYLMSFVGR